MKGRISLKDETKLAFEMVTINTNTGTLTVREVLWNNNTKADKINWGLTNTISLK
jgi:hypothetical protein